jgi:spermidine/putrescine transport system permease protein
MQLSVGAAAPSRASPRRPGLWGWLLVSPMLAWLIAFVAAPGLILLVYSVCERGTDGPVTWAFTLENYHRVFSGTYLKILLRSAWYAGITTLACILIGYPVAYFIARASDVVRNRLLLAVMIPFWTSFLIRTYAWITILNEQGLLNAVLLSGRVISDPLEILYTPTAVVIGLTYTYLPFMILPIYGSVEKLDYSVVEAALDLGANPLRAFWRVIVPLTTPGIMAGVLLVFVPAIGMFAVTDLLGGGRVPMVGNVIQNQFLQARDWPFGAALGCTLIALFAGAFALTLRTGNRDENRSPAG